MAEKGPIERFLDLLNDDAALKIRFVEDPDAVIRQSGITFDPATHEVLVSRDRARVRAALHAELGTDPGIDDVMYDIFVSDATIEWSDSEGNSIETPTYETGVAFVHLYGWNPGSWVAVQVDQEDVSAARIGVFGHTPFRRPFPFQWPAAAYTEGDHVIDAYDMDDTDMRAHSITVTVLPRDE